MMNPGGGWTIFAAGVLSFFVACTCTWGMMRVARRWYLLDRPNERSAHRRPTPTAGGVGIVAGFWAGMGALLIAGIDCPLFTENLGGWSGGTALLLFMSADDLVRPLRVWEKMTLLCMGAGCWMLWGTALDSIGLPCGTQMAVGGWGRIALLLWFLVLCNAFNFMDGIDGITSTQTISVGLFVALSFWRLGADWEVPLILAAAAGGFLVFNFPPGRIFMGDVGSTFLGFTFAALGIWGERVGLPLWIYCAFTGYYLFDTGYTLVRRLLKRENVLRAHRKHLYQRLDRSGWSHGQIDAWISLINLCLGIGGYLWLFANRIWGGGFMALGIALVVGQTLWIEKKDRAFV